MVSADTPIDFEWMVTDGEVELHFEEGEREYVQVLVKCTPEKLVLKHQNNTLYYYKPYIVDAQQ